MLRVRYGIGMTPFSYRAKLKGDATDTFPPTAAFNVIPITLAAGAEGWFGPNNTIGATINLRMSFYGLDTGTPDVLHVRTPLDFDVGGRYRFDLFASPWSAWAGLSFSKSSSMIFQYEDETRSTAVVDVQAVLGVRASGGFRGEWDKLLIEADLGSTFTPIPSIGVGIKGEYRIHDAILVGAAIGTELRAVSIKPDSNESVRINATEFGQQFHLYSGLAF